MLIYLQLMILKCMKLQLGYSIKWDLELMQWLNFSHRNVWAKPFWSANYIRSSRKGSVMKYCGVVERNVGRTAEINSAGINKVDWIMGLCLC